jgi:hypothetical protein
MSPIHRKTQIAFTRAEGLADHDLGPGGRGVVHIMADIEDSEPTGSRLARRRGLRTRAARSKAGLTVLEITITLTIVTTVLMAAAGALLSSLSAVSSAARTSRATVFLETVMEDLAAQPYDNLLAFNGNTIYDQAAVAQSNYIANVSVFTVATNLRQVNVVLNDKQRNREIGRVTTLRCAR